MSISVTLPTNLSTDAAKGLKTTLDQYLGKDLTLDASHVRQVGGLCFQVLLSARDRWRADDKAFIVDGCSEQFRAACARLGLPLEDFTQKDTE